MIIPSPGTGLFPMLLVSLGVHALVLIAGGLLPMTAAPRITFGPVYSVRLVGMPADLLQNTPGTVLSRDILSPPTSKTVVLKKEGEIPPASPIKKAPEVPERARKLDAAVDEIRRRVAARSKTTVGGGTAVDTDNRMAAYYGDIWRRIKGSWILPKSMLTERTGEAIVHARIVRDGSLVDINLAKSSGNASFDTSAVRAVHRAAPFPPLPSWFPGGSLEVGIRFHVDDLK